ncbi:MAG: TraR/DksA family transcriptional regulator [Rhodobacterales bacterium]|nr:TraR/DksA family transcriptional regulator [Rhodobacterales bacterium]MDX5499865.1 TraR/DksA family transcriptional regulator [Rhodobacterales bacterium]
MTTTAERKSMLEGRLATLRTRLQGIEHELSSHQSKDWDDMAIEQETDEVLEGMGHSGLQEMRQIESALQRMADGDYGYCTKCGAEIAPERLDALPHTPFCRNCAP